MWTGDRWGQSPDDLKGHEPQYKVMLHFGVDGRLLPVTWEDEFTIDI